ncbi:ArnT family glycosyltransferase [Propionispora hippei]|uniref:Dolichyl-phosphate-mannose-protein mannosyltransferase n=1 Tax=Propionispora hippei DSM 15287 TaxID=1123003 RepID=A0A1M6H1S3_9FIRM|nr:glycosyltransferase family 39 protein [Propionispora hippei]SHJ16127.1 Dolichyl-phosphate-mannose-protein mannosyltransferase [Propionispora hippei DSM 15287]
MKRIRIVLVLLVAVLLNFVRLDQEGFANLYYAAGVKSMIMNWHNFFFVSSDPGGFITIDKPPLGFWLQTLSAKIFGFHGWSIILPQALGGVVSVYLMYVLVKRYHGEEAGLLSALVLAFTPIFVAASRNNTIDVLLVMTILFAVLVFLQAAETLNVKKLLLAFFLIGVGFNIKSLEAFMILPTFYITYMLVERKRFKTKLIHLFLATLVLIASSLPWFLIVDSISPADRPYVGSSETNSELELATGYNGLGHFLGYGIRTPGRPEQARNPNGPRFQSGIPSVDGGIVSGNMAGAPPKNLRQQGGESGVPGPFRLFNHQMGGQISWLLPFALSGIVISLYQFKRQALPENSRIKMIFWGCWLIPEMIFFSIAEGAHRYYLVMMAPAIAALVGITYVTFATWSASDGKRRYLLPAALFVSVVGQVWLIAGYEEWRSWLLPLVAGIGLLAILLLIWQASGKRGRQHRYYSYVIGLGVIVLLAAPLAWSLTPALYGSGNAAFPFAGPDLQTQLQYPGNMPNFSNRFNMATEKLEAFLMSHRNGEKYIVAVPNAHMASPIILGTGEPVITYGGFMGSEKILDGERLEALVASNQVRYVVLGSDNRQPDIDEWVRSHGVLVPDEEWQDKQKEEVAGRDGGTNPPRRMSMQLYDCHV